MSTATAILEADERRHARDSHRAGGGSQRRRLRSFMTAAEKRENRDEHAARIRLAVSELEDALGFTAWLEALELNPELSAMNAALVALQTPGEIVASNAGWKRNGYRIRKGERAAGRITAPGFWPLPYFTAEQAGAEELLLFAPQAPASQTVEALGADLGQRLKVEKPRPALDAVAKRYREGAWKP